MPHGSGGPDLSSGILNLDKPAGMTSHDVVNRIRRLTGMRRVGHAGTLDPEATGVLLVLLGSATRMSDDLMGRTKRYRAVVRFGATSTTDDAAGQIRPSGVPVRLGAPELRGVLDRFLGPIVQVPPAYAAIKVRGEPLYKRARQGEDVAAPPRVVQIDRLDLLSWDGADLAIDVTCSKGTYIRALARDLGATTGTGAYLASLVRTASGAFRLADAVTLDDVADAAADGYLDRLLYPLDVALPDAPALLLAPEAVARVLHGGAVPGPAAPEGTLARGYDAARGALVAVLRAAPGSWHPEKVFSEDATDGAA